LKSKNLELMSVDELWSLREKLDAILSAKLNDEKHHLERRLSQLHGQREKPTIEANRRRPYPKVLPKYQNPERPFETWSGRGKRPHWVAAQLKMGKKVDDLLISQRH
jgi:DNA-binding protein H-NS